MSTINYFAVVVAAVGSMILGAVWYGPLFGKAWSNLMGWGSMSTEQMAEMKKKASKSYFWTFVTSLVMAYVTANIVNAYGAVDISGGLGVGFWLWLGFIATVSLGGVLWEKKPVKLWVLNNGFNLINLLFFGALLASWR